MWREMRESRRHLQKTSFQIFCHKEVTTLNCLVMYSGASAQSENHNHKAKH